MRNHGLKKEHPEYEVPFPVKTKRWESISLQGPPDDHTVLFSNDQLGEPPRAFRTNYSWIPFPYLLELFFFFLDFLFQRTSGTFCILTLTAQIFSQFFQFLFQSSTLTTNESIQYKTKLFKEGSKHLELWKS